MTNKCFINGVQYKCRTCFDPAMTVFELAEECTNSRTCQDLLNDVAKLKTNEDELLPNTICSKCMGKLINCYDFILHIQNVNEKYHKLLASGKYSSQNDNLASSSKNITGYLTEYPTALPLDRCVSEIKLENEELMPYDIVLNSDERRIDSGKGDDIFEEAIELSQRIEANQPAIRQTTYSFPKEQEKSEVILATLQKILKGQAATLEGQKDLRERLKKGEENQSNILQNQKLLSNGQAALATSQQYITSNLERCETNQISKSEFMAQNNVLMECKVSISKLEQSLCRMAGETVDHSLNEVASMLPLKRLEDVNALEEKLQLPDFAMAVKTFIFKAKGMAEDSSEVIRSLMTDDLLDQFNWEGRWDKKALGNLTLFDKVLRAYNIRDEMDELLQSLNLIEVKPFLKKSQITLESLKYLSREDIKEAIPPIGLRACFREKLLCWRKSQYGIDDDNLPATVANKVVSWLQNNRNLGLTSAPASSICSTFIGNSKLSKSLELILKDSLKGKAIAKYYEKSNRLTDLLRTDLINIILEDILYHEVKLSPKDFPPIVDEIIGNFPCEIKEYYFIPRGRKANPGGKLWDRYVNQKSKRGRLLRKFEDGLDVVNECPAHSEVDESLLQALKTSLSRDFSNWDDVKNKWQRTFPLRQKELKSSKSYFEFLNDWPLYSNPRSLELINIDFELLYPNKAHLLFSKWREFTQKIDNYYQLNIKDKKSKELLAHVKETSNQNSVDYIYTILLNSVIIPTARFSDDIGKNLKKISITDANESFVLHLTTISDCEKVTTELKDKFYSKDLTVQPIIIVVGDSINNLEQFYVYFDKTLLQFDSFLQSLDVCFKITNALNLEYPKGCQGPWLFIQEYFYEIKDVNERKLCSIYSLFNFLKP